MAKQQFFFSSLLLAALSLYFCSLHLPGVEATRQDEECGADVCTTDQCCISRFGNKCLALRSEGEKCGCGCQELPKPKLLGGGFKSSETTSEAESTYLSM